MEKTLGIVGLGKMGKNIALNLIGKGYTVFAYNRSKPPVEEVVKRGAVAVDSLSDFKSKLQQPRMVWVMLPAGEVTKEYVSKLVGILDKDDIIIDGSNSFYKDSRELHDLAAEKGIKYLDAGCSGGPSGALSGMSIMVGGERGTFEYAESLFKDLSVPEGYAYIGPAGSGHFVKMVHNAIEYGMMESIAEGLELVKEGPYKDINMRELCHVWNNGSVIRGYLIELAERALKKDSKLSSIAPFVADTGEGRWAIQSAIEYGVPFTAITHSLYERFSSRSEYRFGRRMLAALRQEFGGHEVKKA
ncbi:MAG: phosphogluconate dehydrogenase (NAD(+)-dependent, decarboxylating) [Candidatus Micrarchaeia archaeon]